MAGAVNINNEKDGMMNDGDHEENSGAGAVVFFAFAFLLFMGVISLTYATDSGISGSRAATDALVDVAEAPARVVHLLGTGEFLD